MLLVPYWQSLSRNNFYLYYNEFGPDIGRFYTVLTVVAAIIPIGISIYCKAISSKALRPALISSFFAILFISCFYIYFKDTNQLFYQAALTDIQLKKEFVIWNYWHWGRVFMECLSLFFLVVSVTRIQNSTA